jgi:hypothetical protein
LQFKEALARGSDGVKMRVKKLFFGLLLSWLAATSVALADDPSIHRERQRVLQRRSFGAAAHPDPWYHFDGCGGERRH